MAHLFSDPAETPQSPFSGTDENIPDFEPIFPVDPIAAPPADQETVVPAEAVSEPKSADSGARAKRGRPAKAAKQPEGKRRKTASSSELVCTSVYLDPELHERVRIASILSRPKQSLSGIFVKSCEDMLNFTYECNYADCNQKFTVVSQDGEAAKPICCPFCGKDSFRRVKTGL